MNFDGYFPTEYLKDHKKNNWNYWQKGYELDRYEIYKIDNVAFKMIFPVRYNSCKIYYNKIDDLKDHLIYLKNTKMTI